MNSPYLFLTLMSVIWGCNFVAAKLTLNHMEPLSAAFWRYLIGVACLTPLAFRELVEVMRDRSTWRDLFLLGFSGIFLYHWLFFEGVKVSEAGAASLVITSNPAVTALFAALILRERMSFRKWVGFGVAAMGALVVLGNGDITRIAALDFGKGGYYLSLAVVVWSFYTLLGKRVMTRVSPLATTAAAFIIGLPMLFIASLLEGATMAAFEAPLSSWLGLVYMGTAASSIAFVYFYKGVAVLGAARASVFIYLIPVFALVSSYFMLGEPVTMPKIAGGLLVVAGVTLTSKR